MRVTSQSFSATGESSSVEQTISADSGIFVHETAEGTDYKTEQARQITITQDLKSITYPGFSNEIEATRNSTGDTASIRQIVSPDSGCTVDIILKGSKIGENSAHHAHGHLDFIKKVGDPATGNDVEINEIVSVDSGYTNHLTLTDGTYTTEHVDAADYAVWREHASASGGAKAIALDEFVGVDSGYARKVTISNTSSGENGSIEIWFDCRLSCRFKSLGYKRCRFADTGTFNSFQ